MPELISPPPNVSLPVREDRPVPAPARSPVRIAPLPVPLPKPLAPPRAGPCCAVLRAVLALPLLALGIWLAISGFLPVAVLAVVLFLPALAPLLLVVAHFLAAQDVEGAAAREVPYQI